MGSHDFPRGPTDCAQASSDPGQRSDSGAGDGILLPLRKNPHLGAAFPFICTIPDRVLLPGSEASDFVLRFVGHDTCAPPTLSNFFRHPPLMPGYWNIFRVCHDFEG